MSERLRRATARDVAAVEALRRADSESVGFIPLPRLIQEAIRGNVAVIEQDGEIVGSVVASMRTVTLLVVARGHRMQDRGRALIAWAQARTQSLQVRCAQDACGHGFWPAAGFTVVASTAPTNRRSRKIDVFTWGQHFAWWDEVDAVTEPRRFNPTGLAR